MTFQQTPSDIDSATESTPKIQTFLLLCPTHRDDRELALIGAPGTAFIRHEYASIALEEMVSQTPSATPPFADPIAEIESILTKFSRAAITGVISTDDYPGSALACVVARHLGLAGASPTANLLCQHKYYARRLQHALVPDAVPSFAIVNVEETAALPSSVGLPAFFKPVKSFFSIGAQRVDSEQQLAAVKRHWASRRAFFQPFERLFEHFVGLQMGSDYLLAEGLLTGLQCTLEGYAFGDDVRVIGIVDSVMFPGTNVFERFEYPSALPESVQDRMAAVAKALMAGLGYGNAMFNIEFIYDSVADRVSIVEINPRMASQFADLYEKVDGFNGYSVLLDLAAGREPRPSRREGPHRVAASFVLRSFEDLHVAAVPSAPSLEALSLRHPDARVEILVSAGRALSFEMQDGQSFRYGIVNLGGQDLPDLHEKFEEYRHGLGFVFQPLSSAPDRSSAQDMRVGKSGLREPVNE